MDIFQFDRIRSANITNDNFLYKEIFLATTCKTRYNVKSKNNNLLWSEYFLGSYFISNSYFPNFCFKGSSWKQ